MAVPRLVLCRAWDKQLWHWPLVMVVVVVLLQVAYPLMQCGLFVAGAWGILLFRELRGVKWQALYWASGAVLLTGAALLAASK